MNAIAAASLACTLAMLLCQEGMALEKKTSVSSALTEEKLAQMRRGLPSRLEVSGHQVRLPSRSAITLSVLEQMAVAEDRIQNWSLGDLLVAIQDPREHIRCVGFLLLMKKTGVGENHSTLSMSLDELRTRGILKKWHKIVDTTRGPSETDK